MWIHKSRRAVARASRKHRQPSQGSWGGRVWLRLRWGVQLGCVLQRYLVLVASTYCYEAFLSKRTFVVLIPRGHRLCPRQETYRRPRAG